MFACFLLSCYSWLHCLGKAPPMSTAFPLLYYPLIRQTLQYTTMLSYVASKTAHGTTESELDWVAYLQQMQQFVKVCSPAAQPWQCRVIAPNGVFHNTDCSSTALLESALFAVWSCSSLQRYPALHQAELFWVPGICTCAVRLQSSTFSPMSHSWLHTPRHGD